MAATLEPTRLAPTPYWRHVVAGLLFGVFTTAAFPPLGIWPFTLVSIIPLVWSAYHPSRRPALGAFFVAMGALPLWFFQERWLINVTELGYPFLTLYLSAYAGLFVFAVNWLSKRFARSGVPIPALLLVPLLWVALEFVRGEIALTGYAWFLIAQPLADLPFLAAPAALFGTYFVSFLVAAIGGALADATGWTPVTRRVGCIGAGSIALVWIISSIVAGSGRSPSGGSASASLRVAVVQTNIPQDNKLGWNAAQRDRDFEQFIKLTRDTAALRPRPDFICWPETMYPGTALNVEYIKTLTDLATARQIDPLTLSDVAMSRRMEDLQKELNTPLVVGAQSLEGFRIVAPVDASSPPTTAVDHRYNSAIIIDSTGVQAPRYDKVELTPFGEVVPYVWRWKSVQAWIENLGAGGMKFDLSVGNRPVGLAFDINQGATNAQGEPDADRVVRLCLLTPICFEATKSWYCRELVLAAIRSNPTRSRLLINLSNDGWFGDAEGKREQHLLAARWRCIELGIPMVRSVNTGVSCFIDAAGRVRIGSTDQRDSTVKTEGVFAETVVLTTPERTTLFTRVGNLFGWAVLGMALLVPFATLILGKRSNR